MLGFPPPTVPRAGSLMPFPTCKAGSGLGSLYFPSRFSGSPGLPGEVSDTFFLLLTCQYVIASPMVFGVHDPHPSSPACLVGPSVETVHIQPLDSLPQSPSSLPSSVSADARLPNCAHTPTSNPFPISAATNLAQAPSCPTPSLGGLSASSLIPLWQPGAAFEKGNSGNVTPCLETPQWSPPEPRVTSRFLSGNLSRLL